MTLPALILISAHVAIVSGANFPVLIIPAFGGSKLTQTTSSSAGMGGECLLSNQELLWFDLLNYLSPSCWLDRAKLVYDNQTRTSSSPPGIVVSIVPGMQSITSVAPPLPELAANFDLLVATLMGMGYVVDGDLQAAPYDFRYSINQLGDWINATRVQIEKMYAASGKPVILIACSIGSVNTYVFLKSQSRAWNNKYIRSVLFMASPFGGSFRFVHLFFTINEVFLPVMTPAQRSWSVIPLLLPRPAVWGNRTLVKTTSKSYSALDYQKFFLDLGLSDPYEGFLDSLKDYDGGHVTTPGDTMSIYCISGSNLPTRRSARIVGEVQSLAPIVFYANEEGDSVVGRASLDKCNDMGIGKKNFAAPRFPGIAHGDTIRSPLVVAYVANIINSINSGTELFSN